MRFESADVQIVAFFALIVFFSAGERLWPARRIDVWKDLRVDLLSFVFALAANRAVTRLIGAVTGDVTPRALRSIVASLHQLPSAARIAFAIVVVDFIVYWIHRSQHTFPLMWRTHAWHHSIEEMYWFSGFRTSFFHSLLNNIPQVVIPVTVFRLTPAEAAIAYSTGLFIQFVEHTNWNLSFGPLNRLLVTPDYHRIHHAATLHRGKNLAGALRIWDVLFGTYVDPGEVSDRYALGLGETVETKHIPRFLVGV
jgi:sterol desaturase/sphingolipid hydroxylase (fatty acid hydroxylase superfamily)